MLGLIHNTINWKRIGIWISADEHYYVDGYDDLKELAETEITEAAATSSWNDVCAELAQREPDEEIGVFAQCSIPDGTTAEEAAITFGLIENPEEPPTDEEPTQQ
jgi:hypothetical protein